MTPKVWIDCVHYHTSREYFTALWDSAKGKSPLFLIRIWYDEHGQIRMEAEEQ